MLAVVYRVTIKRSIKPKMNAINSERSTLSDKFVQISSKPFYTVDTLPLNSNVYVYENTAGLPG